MKRLIILIPIFLLFVLNLFSQDTIFLKSKEEILAKVIEISSDDVKFKKFNNLNGPSYTEAKVNISRIVYQNGTVDEYTIAETPEIELKNQNFEKEVQGIFLAGLTLSRIGGDVTNTKNKQGIAAGFGIDFPFDRLGNYFELTLYYEQKGSSFKDFEEMYQDELYLFTETVIDMEYITLSFIYKRFFGAKKLFYAKAGLYAGFRVSGDIESKLIHIEDNYKEYYNASLENVYSKLDAGATIAAGLNIPVSKGKNPTKLVFETRYNMGLSNIFVNDNSDRTDDRRETNQNIIFMAGLRFPF